MILMLKIPFFCYFDETSKYFYVLVSIKRNYINASINIASKDKNDEFFLNYQKLIKQLKKKDQTITTLLKATVKNNSEFFLCEGKSKTQIFSVKDDFKSR